ncbi:hypothetical protein ACHHYP_06914 [Achlya hypogyna]|uniref:FYVE-type domain-containing protein n=1 Tax=Achlya hypogyna TaxID=1202772 RepID=A0A1V9ZN25_ACHHY|nr:hypothetical protein ACHHYP_06914 [Achlya hypogyna]
MEPRKDDEATLMRIEDRNASSFDVDDSDEEDVHAASDSEDHSRRPVIARCSSSPDLASRGQHTPPPPLAAVPPVMKTSINNLAASIMAIARPSVAPMLSPTPDHKQGSDIGLHGNVGTSVFFSPPLLPPAFANLTICENCKDEVGTLLGKSRHHCRNCGGTFCQACSSKTSVVPFDALIHKGEFRVCDCCSVRIREFHAQTKSPHATWNGLTPISETAFLDKFDLPEAQSPVVIFSCCYFPEISPFYGHLFLTRDYVAFSAYRSLETPILISYDDITAVVKPEFYFINALQLKTKDKTWFFAEFNGLRDMCFVRLDQLILAHRQQQTRVDSNLSPKTLKEMASQRRKSMKVTKKSRSVVPGCMDTEVRCSSSVMSPKSGGDDEDFVPLPPDEALLSMTKVLDCEMPGNVHDIFDHLFADGPGQDFYNRVMVSTKDIDISVGGWSLLTSDAPKEVTSGFKVSTETFTHYRRVESKHPPKVSFPGLPPYAECVRHQLYRHQGDGKSWTRLVIADCLRMNKIPFSDYFEIETRWVFTRDGRHFTHAQVGLVIHFLKSTWFKSQIVSSTISESKEAFETWAAHAATQLRTQVAPGSPAPPSPPKMEVPADTPPDPMPTTTSAPMVASVSASTSALARLRGVPPQWLLLGALVLYVFYTLRTVHGALTMVVQRLDRLEDALARHEEALGASCPSDLVQKLITALESVAHRS